jgi:hypothetical protein
VGCAALSDLVFCEDFESGLPSGQPDWRFGTGNKGSITHETKVVRSGKGAALVQQGDPLSGNAVRYVAFEKKFSPALLRGPIYVRFHVRLASSYAPPQWNILFELTEAGGGPGRVKILQNDKENGDFEVSPAMNRFWTEPNLWVRDRWQCVEVLLQLDTGNGGRAEFFIDGHSKHVISMVPTAPATGWSGFNLGSISDPGTAGIRLHLDDIVVATRRIGCQ